jgi:hypothetical protein
MCAHTCLTTHEGSKRKNSKPESFLMENISIERQKIIVKAEMTTMILLDHNRRGVMDGSLPA